MVDDEEAEEEAASKARRDPVGDWVFRKRRMVDACSKATAKNINAISSRGKQEGQGVPETARPLEEIYCMDVCTIIFFVATDIVVVVVVVVIVFVVG